MDYIVLDLAASDRNTTETSLVNERTFLSPPNPGVTWALELENQDRDLISIPSIMYSFSLSDLCFSLHANLIFSYWFSPKMGQFPKSCRLISSLNHHLRKFLLCSNLEGKKKTGNYSNWSDLDHVPDHWTNFCGQVGRCSSPLKPCWSEGIKVLQMNKGYSPNKEERGAGWTE